MHSWPRKSRCGKSANQETEQPNSVLWSPVEPTRESSKNGEINSPKHCFSLGIWLFLIFLKKSVFYSSCEAGGNLSWAWGIQTQDPTVYKAMVTTPNCSLAEETSVTPQQDHVIYSYRHLFLISSRIIWYCFQRKESPLQASIHHSVSIAGKLCGHLIVHHICTMMRGCHPSPQSPTLSFSSTAKRPPPEHILLRFGRG